MCFGGPSHHLGLRRRSQTTGKGHLLYCSILVYNLLCKTLTTTWRREYWEPIRLYGPRECIQFTQDLIELVDDILLNSSKSHLVPELKFVLGFPNITDNTDFAGILTQAGIGMWQYKNWDPTVTLDDFDGYCRNVSSSVILYPETENSRAAVGSLLRKANSTSRWGDGKISQMLNYIGWANLTVVSQCETPSQDECFGSKNETEWQRYGIEEQDWRSWEYQTCTQWGYFSTSDFPDGVRPIQSTLLDLEEWRGDSGSSGRARGRGTRHTSNGKRGRRTSRRTNAGRRAAREKELSQKANGRGNAQRNLSQGF